MDKRQKIIIQASWVSIFGNAALALLKIILGLVAGSLAVVADGIDSFTDIVTSIITLVTARIISKPPNIRFPYGYEKADTMATKALSFVIFFAGAQLAISTIERLFDSQIIRPPTYLAIYVTLFSIAGKICLSIFLKSKGKNYNSAMLIANARNMQNDVIISLTVLAGLFFTFILKLPLLDSITALIVSLWIMKVAIQIFFQSNTELMDGMKDPILYCELFSAVRKVKGAKNPHRVRVRKIGSYNMISMDIEVDPTITVQKAHEIVQQVENSIKENIPNVYDIVVHVEPIGNLEENERYGLREKDVEGL